MRLFDTHAHYYDTKFEDVEALLISPEFTDKVGHVINIASNPENSKTVIAQAKKHEFMHCAVGIHPSDAQREPEEHFIQNIDKIEAFICDEKIRLENKIVAIGEIGFDYYWQPVDRELQYKYFDAQMCLAEKYGLPVIIHDRDAHGDTFDMIMKHPDAVGVIHSCSMSDEMVRQLCERGWYISFSGTVTFKNAHKVKASCAATDIDRLLSETDAPYLAPHPYRGQLNNSMLMEMTVREMADIHNVTYEEMIEITNKNAKTLFRI